MQTASIELKKIHTNRRLMVTSAVILLCLVLSSSFPSDTGFQSISRSLFFLVIMPALYIKIVLKENLFDWGWNLENKKEGIILSLIAFLVGALLFYALISFTEFSSYYPINSLARSSFAMFLLYELVFLNIFLFAQEFFFKSFVLFAYRKFDIWSVAIQFVIYLFFLFFSGSFSWHILPYIFLSIFGGLITYRTRSFFYSYIFGFLFIMILDAYVIHLLK